MKGCKFCGLKDSCFQLKTFCPHFETVSTSPGQLRQLLEAALCNINTLHYCGVKNCFGEWSLLFYPFTAKYLNVYVVPITYTLINNHNAPMFNFLDWYFFNDLVCQVIHFLKATILILDCNFLNSGDILLL